MSPVVNKLCNLSLPVLTPIAFSVAFFQRCGKNPVTRFELCKYDKGRICPFITKPNSIDLVQCDVTAFTFCRKHRMASAKGGSHQLKLCKNRRTCYVTTELECRPVNNSSALPFHRYMGIFGAVQGREMIASNTTRAASIY